MLTDNKFYNIRRPPNTHQKQQQNYHSWQQPPPPPQWPMPLLQQEHHYLRVHPEYLIRTVIASKITQEQRAAATVSNSSSSNIQVPHSPSTTANEPFSFGLYFIDFISII